MTAELVPEVESVIVNGRLSQEKTIAPKAKGEKTREKNDRD